MEIEVKGLTKEFDGFKAVDDVSFKVKEGSNIILLGESGCGKTTTLKMINRLIEPTSGDVFINGNNVKEEAPEKLRQQMGYVIQDIGLFPHYTVAGNIEVVPRLLKWDRDKIRKRTDELLEMVGLNPEEFKNRMPEELSGGQQQRIGFARALAADPPLVLLDEPFGALDPLTRVDLQAEFKALITELNKTMIMVTHDIHEAFFLGERICLLNNGKVEQIASPEELIFNPANEYVQEFFKKGRFQLELSVIQIQELLPYIKKVSKKTDSRLQFHKDIDLLSLIDKREQDFKRKETIEIIDENDKTILQTNLEEILLAFFKFRAKKME